MNRATEEAVEALDRLDEVPNLGQEFWLAVVLEDGQIAFHTLKFVLGSEDQLAVVGVLLWQSRREVSDWPNTSATFKLTIMGPVLSIRASRSQTC